MLIVKNRFRLLIRAIPELLVICCAVSTAFGREIPQVQSDIAAKQRDRSVQQERLNSSKSRAVDLEAQARIAKQALDSRQVEEDRALATLRKVQELIEQRPDVSIDREKEAYGRARTAKNAARSDYDRKKQDLEQANATTQLEQARLDGINRNLDSLNDELVEARIEKLRADVEQDREVEGYAVASCGNETIASCKRKALEDARRNAVEKASAIVLDSVSQTENYQLTRDEIHMKVTGIIKNETVIDSGFEGESGYRYKIKATVRGVLPIEARRKRATELPAYLQRTQTYSDPNAPFGVSTNSPSSSGPPSESWVALKESLAGVSFVFNGFPGYVTNAVSDCASCYFNQWGVEVIFPFRLSIGISQAHGATNLVKQSGSGFKYNETYRGSETNLEAIYYFGETYHAGFGGLISIASSGSGEETRYNADGTTNTDGTEPITGHKALGLIYSALEPPSIGV